MTQRYHAICEDIISSIDELEQQQQEEQGALAKLDTILNNLSNTVDELLQTGETPDVDQKIVEDNQKTIANLGIEWDDTIKIISSQTIIDTQNRKFQNILDLLDKPIAHLIPSHWNSVSKQSLNS